MGSEAAICRAGIPYESRVPIQDLAVSVLIWGPAVAPAKAVEDEASPWIPATPVGDLDVASSQLCLVQPWLSWSFGE